MSKFFSFRKKIGLNDNRGTLFDNIIDILKTKKPKFSILENVKNIKTIDNGTVYKYIYDKLNKIGYNVFDIILNPTYFGIPQNRERIFFIIIRKDLNFNKDTIIHDILNSKVKPHTILSKNVPNKYNISTELNKIFIIWNEFLTNIKPQKIGFPIRIEYFKIDNITNQLILKNNLLYKNNKIFIDKWLTKYNTILNKKVIYGILEWQTGVTLSNKVSIFDYIVQIRQSGIRVKRKHIFPTLVAIVQTPIINKRYLTPRECARLQSFPENYKFIDNDFITLKQLGNSVNVDVVHIVCKNLLNKFI